MKQEPVLQLAVQMTCEACAKDICAALEPLGVTAECNVAQNSVIVRGDAAPSAVVDAIGDTGRSAIVRGSGAPNSAAVCILEDMDGATHGLVRLAHTDSTIVDLSVSAAIFDRLAGGTPDGRLWLTAHEYGDISRGALSVGAATDTITELAGTSSFTRCEVPVSSLIGRALVLGPKQVGADSLVGIVARSAGAWELDKSVCSCTGRTMWEEPKLG